MTSCASSLVLTMEATSHIFFGRTSIVVSTKGCGPRLRYFSDFHVQVEQQHEVFEEEMERRLRSLELNGRPARPGRRPGGSRLRGL